MSFMVYGLVWGLGENFRLYLDRKYEGSVCLVQVSVSCIGFARDVRDAGDMYLSLRF